MDSSPIPLWRQQGLNYYRLNCFYKQIFGQATWKVSVDAGCDCPNKRIVPVQTDDNKETQARPVGCIFCDSAAFSPSRRRDEGEIFAQIEAGITQLKKRYKAKHFLAYFQPSTNTYGELTHLTSLWERALSHPQIVGLIIGTRPDCVGAPVLQALGRLAEKKWVSLELGVQSLHDSTLKTINRGHDSACALDAIARAKRVDRLHVGAHVILGLPGETAEMMNQTAETLAQTSLDAVKIHNIYITRNTVLENWYNAERFSPPSREEYIQWAADFIERMPENVVIDRISGSVPTPYLIAPDWCADSTGIMSDLDKEFLRRGTRQGILFASK